jgi:hypothetical protein
MWITPDDGQRNTPKHVDFHFQNKFQNLVHLVGFIMRIFHDARSHERKIMVTVLYLFLSHIPKINLNETDYTSANMKWLRVLLNNGRVKSNVPLGSSFSSFLHFYFSSYSSSNSRTGFWKHALIVKSLANFLFFYLLLPLPTSVCSALYSLLCSLFYKLAFCVHVSSSTDI